MKVSVDAIRSLREKTGASLNDVREALTAAEGNEQKAMELLRKRGAVVAERRQGRATGQGRIEAYVHHDGRMAALVEVNCETDFVARTEDFSQFCRDLAMHVAATNPRWVRKDDAKGSDNHAPEEVLLEQPFVKDPGTTIGQLLEALIAKTGENVVVRRFTRFALGEKMEPGT